MEPYFINVYWILQGTWYAAFPVCSRIPLYVKHLIGLMLYKANIVRYCPRVEASDIAVFSSKNSFCGNHTCTDIFGFFLRRDSSERNYWSKKLVLIPPYLAYFLGLPGSHLTTEPKKKSLSLFCPAQVRTLCSRGLGFFLNKVLKF